MSQTKLKVDLSGLNTLLKQLGKGNYARVGVLGGDASTVHKDEKGSQITNAELAIVHEFGSFTRNIPARSFLRMPVEDKVKDLIKMMDTQNVKDSLKEKNYKGILKRLGVAASAIVDDAFSTGGFGKWEKNSPITIKRKGSDSPLIDTSQLRRSITSDVVMK